MQAQARTSARSQPIPIPGTSDVASDTQSTNSSSTSLSSLELLKEPCVLRLLEKHKDRSPNIRSPSTGIRSPFGERQDLAPAPRSYLSTTSPSYVSHSLDEDNPLHWLKAVLKTTTEKLEMETRRANQAEHRAEMAEYREKEEHAKALQAEMAKHQAELDTARADEESKRYRIQLDANEKELRRAEDRITTLETQRSDALRDANAYRQAAENAQRQLREYRAREEGRLLGLTKGYHEGKMRGWSAGRSEGYSRGRAIGREEGWEEGEEEGRIDERRRTVEAMESVLAEEDEYVDDTWDQKRERTRHWAESSSYSSIPNSYKQTSPKSSKAGASSPGWFRRRP